MVELRKRKPAPESSVVSTTSSGKKRSKKVTKTDENTSTELKSKPRRKLEIPRPKFILLDIEGTICPISFVKQTLFPHALQYIQQNTATKWNNDDDEDDDSDYRTYIDAFDADVRTTPEVFVAHVEKLMAQDSKLPALKALQGHAFRAGYEKDEYATPLFDDVVPFLERCSRRDDDNDDDDDVVRVRVGIYSSGSVAAQKMLLAHVAVDGKGSTTKTKTRTKTRDVNGLVNRYFDPAGVGSKISLSSYTKIVEDLATTTTATTTIEASEVLFFTDSVAEAQASFEAGMQALVVVREGNETRYEDGEAGRWEELTIAGFDEVEFI